jgi:polysaccharide export outer membrane protein
MRFRFTRRFSALLPLLLAACAQLPSSGPSIREVQSGQVEQQNLGRIQLVDLTPAVATRVQSEDKPLSLAEAFPGGQSEATIGFGDALEIDIWETPPATLFGMAAPDPRMPSAASPTILPEQVVDRTGEIRVPFVGNLRVVGSTPAAVADLITKRLQGKANHPQVLVRQTRFASQTATVVGEVSQSIRVPLTPAHERVLDALAAAGGIKQPLNKTMLQLTRDSRTVAVPMDEVVRDPRQNIPLHGGDVLAALFQTQSFTALGETGKQDEIPFEAQGISLAQALARAGGLIDSRAAPQGVFLFRLANPGAVGADGPADARTPEGKVPVVYRVNMRDPASFFAMQKFGMKNGDILFVSNSPATELQKFLDLVSAVAYPSIRVVDSVR